MSMVKKSPAMKEEPMESDVGMTVPISMYNM
jgi:hypothetical protein